MQIPTLIAAKDLARVLDVSLRTVWRWKKAGRLPTAIEVGGAVRWNATQVAEWMSRGCPAGSGVGSTEGTVTCLVEQACGQHLASAVANGVRETA